MDTIESMLRAAAPNGVYLTDAQLESEVKAHSTKPSEYIAYRMSKPHPSSAGELVGWQPIETAPKDKPILIAVGKAVGSGCWRTAKHWDTTGHAFYADGCDMPSHATHWMPLPPAPAGGKDGAR